LLFFLDIKNP